MAHPVIHAEIRSEDPDATRAFFADLFGWKYSDGAFPGYAFVDPGVDGALPTAIGPLQGGADAVLFFVGVEDVEALFEEYTGKGARIRHPPTNYPWAYEMQVEDPDGHVLRFGSEPKVDRPFAG